MITRRRLLASTALTVAAGTLVDPAFAAEPESSRPRPTVRPATVPADLAWHDVREWGVEGRAFDDVENYFDRLPARAKGVVRPEVWNLSHDSAGMSLRFETDATDLYARYTNTRAELSMAHMPASGVSGLDIYAKLESGWRWFGGIRPTQQQTSAALATHIMSGKRLYLVHLPLYNGVKSLEIGVPPSASFEPVRPRKQKPILFYGTSITQGGCASRPGMAFTNLLCRRLDRPMLNFGFSGNGRMEVEVARFLAELDPAIFVLDCLANMAQVPVVERTTAVVKLLREKHVDTPILILEERQWADAALIPSRARNHVDRCRELREAHDALVTAGVKNLHYCKGDDLIGSDGEATVDGSHPTDLGMVRYADALEPDLRRLLGNT
jgi:lysophospholipase L1-like esterase